MSKASEPFPVGTHVVIDECANSFVGQHGVVMQVHPRTETSDPTLYGVKLAGSLFAFDAHELRHEKPMRIYVAGPYSAPTEGGRILNTEAAMRAGKALLDKGHAPFIPHLFHYFDVYMERLTGERLPYQTYMDWDDAFLDVCEGFLYLAPSHGANIEFLRAKQLRKRIFYCLEEVPIISRCDIH